MIEFRFLSLSAQMKKKRHLNMTRRGGGAGTATMTDDRQCPPGGGGYKTPDSGRPDQATTTATRHISSPATENVSSPLGSDLCWSRSGKAG